MTRAADAITSCQNADGTALSRRSFQRNGVLGIRRSIRAQQGRADSSEVSFLFSRTRSESVTADGDSVEKAPT